MSDQGDIDITWHVDGISIVVELDAEHEGDQSWHKARERMPTLRDEDDPSRHDVVYRRAHADSMPTLPDIDLA